MGKQWKPFKTRRRTYFWSNLVLFVVKTDPKIWLPGSIFYTLLKLVPVSLRSKFLVNPVETFSKIDVKLTFDIILALFGDKKARNMAGQAHTLYTPVSTTDMPLNKVSLSHNNFLRKWTKTSPNPNFLLLIWIFLNETVGHNCVTDWFR